MNLKEMWSKVDKIEGLISPDERNNRFLSLIRKTEDRISDSLEGQQWCYLQAYCWYNLSDEVVDGMLRRSKLESLLNRVTPESSDYFWARQYLVYFMFDESLYKECLDVLSNLKFPDNLMKKQRWRLVKNNELQLCCKLSLNEEVLPELEKFVNEYVQMTEYERPVLSEFSKCIAEKLEKEGDLNPELICYINKLELS